MCAVGKLSSPDLPSANGMSRQKVFAILIAKKITAYFLPVLYFLCLDGWSLYAIPSNKDVDFKLFVLALYYSTLNKLTIYSKKFVHYRVS